jgi:hypothetical protein
VQHPLRASAHALFAFSRSTLPPSGPPARPRKKTAAPCWCLAGRAKGRHDSDNAEVSANTSCALTTHTCVRGPSLRTAAPSLRQSMRARSPQGPSHADVHRYGAQRDPSSTRRSPTQLCPKQQNNRPRPTVVRSKASRCAPRSKTLPKKTNSRHYTSSSTTSRTTMSYPTTHPSLHTQACKRSVAIMSVEVSHG